jgi:hypothetical protein
MAVTNAYGSATPAITVPLPTTPVCYAGKVARYVSEEGNPHAQLARTTIASLTI